MIRVLHIISTDALAGTERYLIDLVVNAGNDLEVAIVCPNTGPLRTWLRRLPIKVYEISFAGPNLPQTAFRLLCLIRRYRPNVVHTHLGKATLVGTLAARVGGVKTIITTLHFIEPAYSSTHVKVLYPFFLLGHKLVNRNLTRMIAISRAVRDATIEREKVPLNKIVQIPHGTAAQIPRLDEAQRRAERSAVGIDPTAQIIISVARLEQEKGHRQLLTVIPKILAQFPNTHFLWVGDGSLRQELIQEVAARGLDSQVHMLGFQTQVAPLLALADIFLLPAPAEPFGLAVLEAMIARLPVVAVNAGGPAEIVVPQVTGLLTAPDPESIAAAVCKLLGDRAYARQLGEAGYARCISEYSVERMVQRTEKLYKDLVDKTRNA